MKRQCAKMASCQYPYHHIDADNRLVSLSLGEHTVMEVFLIGLALIAGTGVVFFLFVIEPRRKVYDYDPSDLR